MNTLSNINTNTSVIEEINIFINELLNISKKILYKHHNILGYF